MYMILYSLKLCCKSELSEEDTPKVEPSRLWIFLHLSKQPTVKKLSFYALLFLTILAGFFLVELRSRVNSALGSLQYLDCSYHRILQYFHYGSPQQDWELSEEYLKSRPKTSQLSGFFGVTGYGYYLNTIQKEINKVKIAKSSEDGNLD